MAAALAPAPVVARSTVALRLRRVGDRVDLVISGLGANPRILSQSLSPSRWVARLNGVQALELTAQQQVAMPELGLESIRLAKHSVSGFDLTVQASRELTLSKPRVSANGKELIVSFSGLSIRKTPKITGQLDLRRPGRVNQPNFIPPLQRRATAPPLGDIAVGTMLINQNDLINAAGPPVSLVLNNAPAKDALMSLARIGGFSFVYVNSSQEKSESEQNARLVSMAFKNESYGRALNSVLLASGLQAKLDGRTLLVGEALQASSFAPKMSKVFRLNQVSTETAANYLSSLGAQMSRVRQIEVTRGESASAGTSELSSQVSQTKQFLSEVETLSAQQGPLMGVVGTTDGRLNTVTIVGESRLISLAESYLKQIDLRKRQVALKVQIISVSLDNEKSIDSSFSSRMGNTFIVSESGKGHVNFGDYKPGNVQGGGVYGEGVSGVPGTYSNYGQVPQQRVIDPVVAAQSVASPVVGAQTVVDPVVQEQAVFPPQEPGGQQNFVPKYDSKGRPIYVPDTNPSAQQSLKPVYDNNGQPVYIPSTDPNASPDLRPVYDSNGRPVYVPDTNPGSGQTLMPVYDKKGRVKYVPSSDQYRQPNNSFYAYLEAQIQSRSAKILAQPTLLVKEGQTSAVRTGLEVVVNIEDDENGRKYERETAGLTLTVGVDRIDDNGFVTMTIVPKLGFPILAGEQGGIPFYNIDSRELVANGIRLRDKQTLIVSGVISEQQSEEVKKWPILGDLPVIGSLFRASQSTRSKEELVVVVTPQVLDDEQGGVYGYGYAPGTSDVQQVLNPVR